MVEAAGRGSSSSRVVRELDELGGLRAPWRDLAQGAGPPEQPAWSLAAAETLAGPGQVQVTVVEEAGRPVAIAAMRLGGKPPSAHVELLGAAELDEPTELVHRDGPALATLLATLLRQGRVLRFDRLLSGSRTASALRSLPLTSALVVLRPALACPYIDLDRSWAEPEGKLTPRRRSDLRRAERRAAQLGTVETEVLAPEVREVPELLDLAFGIEHRSWKGRAGTSLLSDHKRGDFFRRYAELAAADGTLRIAVLRVGRKPAAVQIAAESAGAYWLLKIGYDEEHARCSPGLLLLRDTIARAAERGLRRYEFLGLPAPWISAWRTNEHPCVSARVFPSSGAGLAALAAEAARVAARKVVAAAREPRARAARTRAVPTPDRERN